MKESTLKDYTRMEAFQSSVEDEISVISDYGEWLRREHATVLQARIILEEIGQTIERKLAKEDLLAWLPVGVNDSTGKFICSQV